jgi:hypothetical protein
MNDAPDYDRYDAAYDSHRKPQHSGCLSDQDCPACEWEEARDEQVVIGDDGDPVASGDVVEDGRRVGTALTGPSRGAVR